MRYAQPETAEGEWREWGRGGPRVSWPVRPGDLPYQRCAHELSEPEIARAAPIARRRPFHRLAVALLGLTAPAIDRD
jgi:hypothetical protein